MAGVKELAHIKSIHARIILEKGTPDEQIHEGDYVLLSEEDVEKEIKEQEEKEKKNDGEKKQADRS